MVDSVSKKVVHIDFPSQFAKSSPGKGAFSVTGLDYDLETATTDPPPLTADAFAAAGRDRIPPPRTSNDFLPDLIAENHKKAGKEFKLRDDIKPLHVTQPEGVSFTMHGNELEWQKWKMHICTSVLSGSRPIPQLRYSDRRAADE